jgi:hypothetical protein
VILVTDVSLARVPRPSRARSGRGSRLEVMIPVLEEMEEMEIVSRLGCFIGDNAGNNDTWRAICRKLRSDIKEPDSGKVRCLGHILNLVAKAFPFGKDADAFEEDTNSKRGNAHIEKLREVWRKKGPMEVPSWLYILESLHSAEKSS